MSSFAKKVLGAGVVLVAMVISPLVASAALIDVGTIDLEPNKAGQFRTLNVSGGEQIAGAILIAMIGDGGPDLGGTPGPVVDSVDLVSGIFSQKPSTAYNADSFPQLLIWQVFTNSMADRVTADGAFVTLEFNTTGLLEGEWNFAFLGVEIDGELYDTQLLDFDDETGEVFPIDLTITPGLLRIVPEPASFVLVLSAVGLGGLVFWRRRSR